MRDERFWQLKESAKWSLSLDEKRQAIEQLVNIYGKDALHTIEEIKDVTAYEEVRSACIEAIKSARTTAPTAASSEKGAAADQDKKNGNNDNTGAKTKAKSAGMKKSRKAKRKNNNHRHSQ